MHVPDRRLQPRSPDAERPLIVALVNNMPDGALAATEQQFLRLVDKARGSRPVAIRRFHFPETARGDVGRRYLEGRSQPVGVLLDTDVEGLIVTGCEPRAATLPEEPFWPSFTALIDWARTRTGSAIWSCLAAHAAVLHMDGIARHRLPRKLSGVYDCFKVADNPLLAGLGPTIVTPHSRLNDLREADLAGRGYTVLTRSAETGVDCFVKSAPSRFVFFQGHPEYGADTLGREYRRDKDRYRSGKSETCPTPPEHYDLALEGQSRIRGRWQDMAVSLYENWLSGLAPPASPDAVTMQTPARLVERAGVV